MENYIAKLLLQYCHKDPAKPQLLTHRFRDIIYGTKEELAPKYDVMPNLTLDDIRPVQAIVLALLYYSRSVDIKLLIGLSAIGTQQVADMEKKSAAIDQFLDYIPTYPNDGITF